MAVSTCTKCGSYAFEMVENTPNGSEFKVMFIQCSSCGGVVGVTDYYNVGGMLETLATKLKVGTLT